MFIDTLGAGGKERRLVELLKHLHDRRDIHFEIALMSMDIHYQEITSLDIPIHFLLRRRRKDLSLLARLYQLCRRIRPDIIHTWDIMTSQYACGIAKVLGIRFVNGMVTASDDMSWQEKKFWKAQVTYFLSDRVMGNSDAGLKAYRVPRRKAVRIYNGFDFERLKNLDRPEDVKKRFGIQASHVVGMVASFSKSKDYETLILAGKKILQKRNDVAFVTIGDGENLEAMKRLAGQDNFSRILFLGKQKDIESIVNIFDVGVLATYTEGLSNSIMEYMALAKPVVATDGGGTKELVLDGITGFLVRPQSPDELAERIEYILDNSERAQAMGIAGRERIEKEFSIQKMSKEVTSLYDELIGNRSSLS